MFTLLHENADLIQREKPRTPFDRCGYQLREVLNGENLDLARLLTGSEGTLAPFTEITLRTVPLAGGRALLLLRLRQPGHGLARRRGDGECAGCLRSHRPPLADPGAWQR